MSPLCPNVAALSGGLGLDRRAGSLRTSVAVQSRTAFSCCSLAPRTRRRHGRCAVTFTNSCATAASWIFRARSGWPILYLGVLPRRPARSARLYKKVWTAEGSPLAVITQAQADRSRCETPLQRRDHSSRRRHAIRPSVDRRRRLTSSWRPGCDRLVALPMYPQYASATTGSSLERLFEILGRKTRRAVGAHGAAVFRRARVHRRSRRVGA